jgi:hypothetical protein
MDSLLFSNSQALDPVLSQMNPVHILKHYFSKILQTIFVNVMKLNNECSGLQHFKQFRGNYCFHLQGRKNP